MKKLYCKRSWAPRIDLSGTGPVSRGEHHNIDGRLFVAGRLPLQRGSWAMSVGKSRQARLAGLHPRAREMNERGRGAEVAPICEEILGSDLKGRDTLRFIGMWHLDHKAYAEAADYLGRLATLVPGADEFRLPLAMALKESGQAEAALEHARVALRSGQYNYFPYLFLGSIFQRLGEIERASIAYRTAARLKPGGASLSDDSSRPAYARDRARRGHALIHRSRTRWE